MPHIENFLEQSGKSIIQNQIRVQDLEAKAMIFLHYYILFFDVADMLTVNF